MTPGVVLLNFGEPERPEPSEAVAYLERIFLANRRLDGGAADDAAAERARRLAERRAPGFLEELERIGGSPLHRQTLAQADALAGELRRRGRGAVVVVGMQFTSPGMDEAVAAARGAGASRLLGLPLYPLCGPSTTVPALAGLRRAAQRGGLPDAVDEIVGWHRHPGYTALRADGVRAYCRDRGLDLADPSTRLVFAAHGTPVTYLRAGSRYELYVRDHCRAVAEVLGVERPVVGYQNHSSRPGVEWTGPEIGAAIRGLDADRVVVVPVSFMQEQSETLAELDQELREQVEGAGLELHRVPVPHDDPRFATLLADLVDPFLGGDPDPGLRPCRCRGVPGAVCLNAGLAPP
jgi:ferrochelatase